MTDKILQRYMPRQLENGTDATLTGEVETTDDLGAFGWLRGVRDRAIMLELRRKDGSVIALSNSWLDRVEFDPSEGILLRFAGQSVRIVGRNLNAEARPNVRLFNGLIRHRVPWIQEADGPTLVEAGKRATVIEEIKF